MFVCLRACLYMCALPCVLVCVLLRECNCVCSHVCLCVRLLVLRECVRVYAFECAAPVSDDDVQVYRSHDNMQHHAHHMRRTQLRLNWG